MKDSVSLSEADLALVEALQISPRAPWSAVARATASTPVTAARRWNRLVESGAAWVTGTPGVSVWNTQCVAFVGIRCSPGRNLSVARTLAGDAHALSVELTAGDFDLFVTVAAADLGALSRYLLERIDLITGVTDTQTRICTHLYRDGSGWRLGTLPQQAVSALSRRPDGSRTNQPGSSAPRRSEDRHFLVQLGLNGRSSYTALAEAAGVSEATARRRVNRLLVTGTVVLRAEVATHLTGWRVPVILSIDAPSGRLAETAAAIAQLRHVRLCATLAGTPAIVVVVWLRDVEAIHDFETTLAKAIPHIRVGDRLVVLRPVKRMGRLLDEYGRAIGAVPMDVWADPVGMAP
jgi:DNA-binding Lrp family transcriptional regulator